MLDEYIGKNYQLILADPPWQFKTYSAKGKEKKSPENHYNTMDLEDIKNMPVKDIVAKDALCAMWCIDSMIPHALEVMEAWDFKMINVLFYWHKVTKDYKNPAFGLGYYTRKSMELCILGKRGKGLKVLNKGIRQAIVEPIREHSRKPDCTHERLEKMFGDIKRLELFARQNKDGWDTWGNEVDKFSPCQPQNMVLSSSLT